MRGITLGALWSLYLLSAYAVAAAPSPESLHSSITTLIVNDLQGTRSPFADSGLIILDARSHADASKSCQALGEELWAPELGISRIRMNLDYLKYTGKYDKWRRFWVKSGHSTARTIDTTGHVSSISEAVELPVLCTHSAPFSNETYQDKNKKWQVQIRSNNDYITGFRDRLSFRFLGIRYATQPKRFAYPVPYTGNNSHMSATQYGSACVQGSSGSEDCHFLNVWTPYLPGPKSGRRSLRPVMFWIHGGGFVSGTGNDKDFDGGNLASRSDVVVVAINYRLGTFGFLALDDGMTNGNFGLADQIAALNWVRSHIGKFGGDPDRITIFGQSAGAASVRALAASPKALGKFAAAIPLSSPGGVGGASRFSKYMTIDEEMKEVGNALLTSTNCTDATSQVNCLRSIPSSDLSAIGAIASFLVVDGTYLVSDELDISKGSRYPFHLMIGTTRDDGAAFIGYPRTTNQSAYLASLGLEVPSPKLFPVPNIANKTLGLFNMTARLATDGQFRCIDQATAYGALFNNRLSSAYYYEFNRTYQLTNYPRLDVCEPPKSTAYPHGDPDGEYFKCHSGELYYLFGNLAREGLPMRDENDLPFQQFIVDSFSSFARTYNPNPDPAYLRARGYSNTLREIERIGKWKPATKRRTTKRVLQWPSFDSLFTELEQCQELRVPLDHYEAKSVSSIFHQGSRKFRYETRDSLGR
ncbi:Alpha/Beta hydrolase protein [Xylaria bambusicola]|uniref:Alpha/Beta hydrolase protein n=1 Tax=Xylaria bambusicola TaxID=326684 RepID=UPI0020084292|nr:Alpha/Beta hydrolase protein [Xylaria bambusicola]KAI0517764.1 Alpha/Beta hydrolase protein [Xylaria bambusicola]